MALMHTNEKKLMLFAGRAHPELADRIAKELGIDLSDLMNRFEEQMLLCSKLTLNLSINGSWSS
jgi:hypothetical protein